MLLGILDEPDQIHILLGGTAIVHSNPAKTTFVVSEYRIFGMSNLRNIEPSE